MTIQLFDSLTRSVKEIAPADGELFRFYCCGPTVYGPSHIGNFRTFVLQDVFRRTLEAAGITVKHVRNLTDVDDKTIRQSQAEQTPLREFTTHWTRRFREDAEALNLLPPHVEPAATDHIDEQIKLIQCLIDSGNAYAAADGSVYFRVSSFEEYGKLSRLKEREITTASRKPENTNDREAGLEDADNHRAKPDATVDADEYERDSAADFALWKARKPEDGDVFWKSPWGEGRPGWHIECSAMSMAYLGETFDMHGGGADLIFPHHENEIAQSEACTHKPFARHWFHGTHLMVEGKKMSKSLGNLYTVDDVRRRGFSPEVLRYELLSGHYRQPLNFTWASLKSAGSALHKLQRFRKSLASRAEAGGGDGAAPSSGSDQVDNSAFTAFWEALYDDLNTPAAIGALFSAIKEIDSAPLAENSPRAQSVLAAFDRVLGVLGIRFPASETRAVPADIERIAEERWEAKKNRDFATADRLRGELRNAGWSILDRKDGYSLEPAKGPAE